VRFSRSLLPNAQPGETRGGTQLPRQGPLLTRAVECLQEIAIGRRDSLRGSFQQDQFALDALQLGQAPAPFTAFATRQRLIDGQDPCASCPASAMPSANVPRNAV